MRTIEKMTKEETVLLYRALKSNGSRPHKQGRAKVLNAIIAKLLPEKDEEDPSIVIFKCKDKPVTFTETDLGIIADCAENVEFEDTDYHTILGKLCDKLNGLEFVKETQPEGKPDDGKADK